MRFWLRQGILTLGSNRYTLDNMRFSFKVGSEDRPKVPTAEIEIYNLSAATRAGLQKGMPLILNAGYKGDVGVIFVGEVREFSTDIQELDNVTKIKAADCMEAWLASNVNKTYKAGMYAKDILDDLLNVFGVEVGKFELAENKFYPRARVCKGKLKDVLTQIIVSDCKSRLIIRTGQVMINPPEQPISMGFLLTPETGLLKTAQKKEKQDTTTETKPNKKTRQEQSEADGGLKKECLLNYHIGVADLVTIRDNETNGNFRVVSVGYEGSRDGPWKTVLEVKPA